MARPKHRKRNAKLTNLAYRCLVLSVPTSLLTFAALQHSSVVFETPRMQLDIPPLPNIPTTDPLIAPTPTSSSVTKTHKHTPTTTRTPTRTNIRVPATKTTNAPVTARVKVNAPVAVNTTPPQAPPVPVMSGSFRLRFYTAAKSYLGSEIPYVYGGKSSSSGLDCSGFIWDILKQLRPLQPYRNSSALNNWTIDIPQSAALPGDLVFWSGHVAVYAGNNKVITQGGPGAGPILLPIWPGYSFGRIPL